MLFKSLVLFTANDVEISSKSIVRLLRTRLIGTQFIFYSYIVLLEYQLPRPAVGKGYISNPHGIHLDLKENRFRFPKLRQSNPIYFSDRYC